MKNNIGFFTHEVEASEHRKFLILRTHYGEGDKGWAMEGRFWRLNSLIGKADNCRLDTNLKGEKARIAHDLGLGLKDLDEFLTVLETDSELIHNEKGVIWTDQTQEDLKRAEAARTSARKRKYGSEKESSGELSQSSGELSQSSGDEIHGAEQSRSRSGAGVEFSKSKQSELRRSPDELDPETPARPLADIDFLREKILACEIPLKLENVELERIASRLTEAKIQDQDLEPLLAYLVDRAKRTAKKNLSGLFKNALLEYDWHFEFAAQRPKPKKPKAPKKPAFPDPPPCSCGTELLVGGQDGDVARCTSCGAVFEYDPEIGWIKTRDGIDSKTG